mgnify:CR=1 FL=1
MKKSFTLKSSKSKPLNGTITIPSDKSISIRSLIIGSLCIGNAKIFNLLESDDVISTLKALEKLIKNNLNKLAIVSEFWDSFKHRKKWWLLPIIIFLVLFSIIIVFAEGSALAPFIYTLF